MKFDKHKLFECMKNWRWWVALVPAIGYGLPAVFLIFLGRAAITIGEKLAAIDDRPPKWFCRLVDWVYKDD